MAHKGGLSVALVYALMVVGIQCAVCCTIEPCDGSGTAAMPSSVDAPPCHHHHDAPNRQIPAPAGCSHQIVQAQAAQAIVTPVFTATVVAMDLPAAASTPFPSLSRQGALAARDHSPPRPGVLSSLILRI